MFDNLKKIQELKRMQDALKAERETVEKKGVSVTVNGGMEVERITLNSALDQEETEQVLRQCINEANKNIQKRIAKMMMDSGMGGLSL
jgi:DNA-binding protein YbaB